MSIHVLTITAGHNVRRADAFLENLLFSGEKKQYIFGEYFHTSFLFVQVGKPAWLAPGARRFGSLLAGWGLFVAAGVQKVRRKWRVTP